MIIASGDFRFYLGLWFCVSAVVLGICLIRDIVCSSRKKRRKAVQKETLL
jgi:hypothetical protein